MRPSEPDVTAHQNSEAEPPVRAALQLLAEARAGRPALFLNGEAHPALHPLAVVQPHKTLRNAFPVGDYNGVDRFAEVHVLATPSKQETLEYLALARRAVSPGGLIFLAVENGLGADGWRRRFRPERADSKYHARLLQLNPELLPESGDPRALRTPEGQDFESCPGLFSWDRFDPGSQMLLSCMPDELPGYGADFGCGPGLLARELLDRCERVDAFDVDVRAVAACRVNTDGKVRTQWMDLAREGPIRKYSWITLNPPFHAGGREQRALGIALLGRAVRNLEPGGTLWLVANQDLPYEAVLDELGMKCEQLKRKGGYKVLQARALPSSRSAAPVASEPAGPRSRPGKLDRKQLAAEEWQKEGGDFQRPAGRNPNSTPRKYR